MPQGWKLPCFWWNIKRLINYDIFCIILQYWLLPKKLQPPIATYHKFISNAWILQPQVITLIKAFLSLCLWSVLGAGKWYCPGAAVLILGFGYQELASLPAACRPEAGFLKDNCSSAHLACSWGRQHLLHNWVWIGSFQNYYVVGLTLALTLRKVISTVSDPTGLASSH